MDSKDSKSKKLTITKFKLGMIYLSVFIILFGLGYFVKYGKYLPGDLKGVFIVFGISIPLLIIISLSIFLSKSVDIK
jgi:hypothetical protein